jgi:hypothetical protein
LQYLGIIATNYIIYKKFNEIFKNKLAQKKNKMVKEIDKSFQMFHFRFSIFKINSLLGKHVKIALLLYFVIQFGKGFQFQLLE